MKIAKLEDSTVFVLFFIILFQVMRFERRYNSGGRVIRHEDSPGNMKEKPFSFPRGRRMVIKNR
jgi:hypothetical protein